LWKEIQIRVNGTCYFESERACLAQGHSSALAPQTTMCLSYYLKPATLLQYSIEDNQRNTMSAQFISRQYTDKFVALSSQEQHQVINEMMRAGMYDLRLRCDYYRGALILSSLLPVEIQNCKKMA
jgi:hypothetical protein